MRVRQTWQRWGLGLRTLAMLLAPLLASGCGIGHNRTLFFTTANIGLNIDSAPPIAELSISRRENVLGPSLEGGVKPPVLASFQSHFIGIFGVLANVSSAFAGGDAALTLADLYDQPTAGEAANSTLCVAQGPNPQALFGYDVSVPGPGGVKPFLAGTDTSFGLKVQWSGATAQFPDSVKLGYNRKEWALAPVFARPASSVSGTIASTEVAIVVDKKMPVTTQLVKFKNEWVYVVTPRTVVLRGGQPVKFETLAPGDDVVMYGTYLVEKRGETYVPAPVSPGVRNSPCSWDEWEVNMASFLATVDHTTNLQQPSASGDDHVQLFATGAAATRLATQQAVRAVMLRRMDPKAAAVAETLRAFTDDQTKQITAFRDIRRLYDNIPEADKKTKIVDRAKRLGLVEAATTNATFRQDLNLAINGNDPKKTEALETLRDFARNPQ